MSKQKSKWTKQKVHDIAKRYMFRKDFRKNDYAAFRAAQKNGWMDEVCAHMEVLWAKKWDYESCRLEALKYKTRTKFQEGSTGAYQSSVKNGWLDEFCTHMVRELKWNFDACRREALNYSSRSDFQKGSGSAYNAAQKNNWLDEICSHMMVKKSVSFEEALVSARNYTSRVEFMRGDSKAYNVACNNGWLDDIGKHWVHGSIKWTKERSAEEAKQYDSRKAFQVGSGGAYRAALDKGWLDEICSHMTKTQKDDSGQFVIWTFERVEVEARKFKSRSEFANLSSAAYSRARTMSWLDSVCAHMDVLWEEKWDYESCRLEALKYSTRTDFIREGGGAYGASRKNDWLDEICSHMVDGRIKWTVEAIKEEASKFKTRSEFAEKAGSAYHAASAMSVLDDVCAHMKILHNGYFHCAYVILNERLRSAYVGVTSQVFSKRTEQHRLKQGYTRSKFIVDEEDTIFKQLTEYETAPDDVKALETYWYKEFESQGYSVLNSKSSLGSVGYSRKKWEYDSVKGVAAKYKRRWDFQRMDGGAYRVAKENKWLDDICAHMERGSKEEGYWTLENCLKAVSKYKTWREFRSSESYCYKIVCANKWNTLVRARLGANFEQKSSNVASKT